MEYNTKKEAEDAAKYLEGFWHAVQKENGKWELKAVLSIHTKELPFD